MYQIIRHSKCAVQGNGFHPFISERTLAGAMSHFALLKAMPHNGHSFITGERLWMQTPHGRFEFLGATK